MSAKKKPVVVYAVSVPLAKVGETLILERHGGTHENVVVGKVGRKYIHVACGTRFTYDMQFDKTNGYGEFGSHLYSKAELAARDENRAAHNRLRMQGVELRGDITRRAAEIEIVLGAALIVKRKGDHEPKEGGI